MYLRVMIAAIVLVMSVATANSQQPDKIPMNLKKYAIPKENLKKLVLDMGSAFATDQIMVDGKKIGYMYREEPDSPHDSGWRFFSGDEIQSYVDDPSHTAIYAVNTLANYDPDIIPYLNISPPCAFEKVKGSSKYRRVKQ